MPTEEADIGTVTLVRPVFCQRGPLTLTLQPAAQRIPHARCDHIIYVVVMTSSFTNQPVVLHYQYHKQLSKEVKTCNLKRLNVNTLNMH